MERRIFLINSSKLGLSAAASSMLVGCGGGSSSTPVSLSEIDTKIVSLDDTQAKLNDSHVKIQNNLNFSDIDLNSFYAKTFPTDPSEATSSILSDNYLTHMNNDKNLWQNAQSAHQIAYEQYKHQYTKMKAALRLFDYQQDVTLAVDSPQAKTISIDDRRESIIAENDVLGQFLILLENISNQTLSVTVLNLIGTSLTPIIETLNNYMQNDVDTALDYASSAYLVMEVLLNWIKDKALSDLNFTTGNEILISLAKITVAIISILALVSLKSLDLSQTDLTSEQENVHSFLTNNSLDSKVSSVWMDISSKTTLSSIDELKKNAKLSVDTGTIPDNSELISNLKSKSQILTITAVIIKELFAKIADDAFQTKDTMTFTSGSTADNFKILFGADKNPYDEALNNMMNDKKSDFSPLDPTLSGNIDKTFKISITNDAIDIEEDAYLFATELANLAFTFASNTTTQAVEFATHLADLAYAFTMDIEEDAYQFALQGMEWGYLFASRGEEVGLMADRVLWMAVQIGVMADRIGEMADRIVYTEQLIVYTEILILDFGILIYGFGSQITNLILTGMALVFDREWYTPDANSIVLDTINNNVMVMLDNMQEYALAVLNHQTELRELTLDALDVLPYAQPEVVQV
ncbi:MAG: hypothetical protein KJO45_05660 [Sulfurovum sp.]|nr:hypothetical protein [Sulfurovum sp.]